MRRRTPSEKDHRLETNPPLAALALLALGTTAQAETFGLTYSGAAFGNAATGIGTITLDLSVVNNPGATYQSATPFVTDFSITISGASAGNGTFGLADYTDNFGDFILTTNGGTLDFSRELIGQPTDGAPFGTTPSNGEAGDFNIFASFLSPAAPTGTYFFQITTDGGFGDNLFLTSFSPLTAPVPEPGALALLGGFACLGGLALRRRARK